MTWQNLLSEINTSEFYQELWQKVETEYENHLCFPEKKYIFRAFDLCTLDNLKVVILGQDPYHDDRQANGLAFSVANDMKTPPSLRNIYKELYQDLGIVRQSNELEDWAEQGILLLNSVLTVRAHEAGSHKILNWEKYTDEVIRLISKEKSNVIFVLWGSYAQKKTELIDSSKHFIISSAHPSPLSAHRGFFGSRPFSTINHYLQQLGEKPINWEDKYPKTLF